MPTDGVSRAFEIVDGFQRITGFPKISNSGYLYPVMADEQLILQVSEKTQRTIFSPLVQKHTQTLPDNSIKLTLAAITS